MKFIPTVQFSRYEMRRFEDAFGPIHVIDDLIAKGRFGAPSDGTANPEERVLRLINRITKNREHFDKLTLQALEDMLVPLAQRLQTESMAQPDPKWVAEAKKAVAEGKMVLVPDPEQAVAVLRETRAHQFLKAQEGLTLLRGAIEFLTKVYVAAPVVPPEEGVAEDESFD